jgi:hypothetical protein
MGSSNNFQTKSKDFANSQAQFKPFQNKVTPSAVSVKMQEPEEPEDLGYSTRFTSRYRMNEDPLLDSGKKIRERGS